MDEPSEGPFFSSLWRSRFRRGLLAWYRREARDLPWRRSRDPYRIWVSEIMLQQTQVATVEPYFERFLDTFPTVYDLAEAEEESVLRLWEGLGYYRRARQLHLAAQVVVREHGGKIPRDPDLLRELPGIGRYTAGAILSIGFDARAPILEANTIRLFSRLLGYRDDPTKSAGQRILWAAAEELLPRKDVGVFNQALMELGGRVCAPRNPKCDECPARSLCNAKQKGLVDEIPKAKPKTRYQDLCEAAVLVRRDDQFLVVRCQEGERWAGLWDFPRFELDDLRGRKLARRLAEGVEQQTGIRVEPVGHLETIKHGVTRFRITLHCHAARYVSTSRKRMNDRPEMRWLRASELKEVPLSTTGRRISRLALAMAKNQRGSTIAASTGDGW